MDDATYLVIADTSDHLLPAGTRVWRCSAPDWDETTSGDWYTPDQGVSRVCIAPEDLLALGVQPGYTSEPTHLRIYKEDYGDEFPWCLDGVDDAGNFTEDLSRFRTMDECIDVIPQFLADNAHLNWRWNPQRQPYIRRKES